MSFHAVILAAGRGRRMGAAKHLLELHGRPLLAHVVEALSRSRARGITVVLRPGDAEGASLAESLGVGWVWAEDSREGRAASVRAGVRAAPRGDHLLLAMADQPFLEGRDFDALMAGLPPGGMGIAHASYGGVRGTPVVFSAGHRDALLDLRGSEGGRTVIASSGGDTVAVELPVERGCDLDTPEDLTGR